MAKKRKKLTSKVLDVVAGGVALGAGSLTVGAVGAAGGAQTRALAARAHAGLGVAGVAMPVAGAGIVLGEMRKMGKVKKPPPPPIMPAARPTRAPLRTKNSHEMPRPPGV